jgi:hypothetical protein
LNVKVQGCAWGVVKFDPARFERPHMAVE